jgi:hypothetical protein
MDRVIGRRLFTDRLGRDVYEDGERRQYVFDPDGERVYGRWLLPADKPYAVSTTGRHERPRAPTPAQRECCRAGLSPPISSSRTTLV